MITMHRRQLVLTCSGVALGLMSRPARALGSWDAHLAKLNNSVKCKAAIYGFDGAQWAGQSQVQLPAKEIKYLIAGFDNPAALMTSKGATLNGVKYFVTRADSGQIVLKNGKAGAIFGKSHKAVTACLFDESDTTPAQANVATANFVDYLKSIGF